jgi:hypothetical protein
MKITTMIITTVIIVAAFSLGLILVGEGILQQKYGVDDAPSFAKVDNLYGKLGNSSDNFEQAVLAAGEEGQRNDNPTADDGNFWTYTGRSLSAVWDSLQSVGASKSALSEVAHYLKVNPIITSTIVAVVVLSIGFALVAWWKGRVV